MNAVFSNYFFRLKKSKLKVNSGRSVLILDYFVVLLAGVGLLDFNPVQVFVSLN